MLRLLIHSLCREFYRQHAGIFIVGIYLLFGIVEPSQLISYHETLLLSGISSLSSLLIVFAAWILYAVKIHLFIRQKQLSAEYRFIYGTTSLSLTSQFRLWYKLYLIMLLPVLVYALLMIGLGLKNHLYNAAMVTGIFFLLLTLIMSVSTSRRLSFGFLKQEKKWFTANLKISKKWQMWSMLHLVEEMPITLLVCKGLSFVFFNGILWMFADIGHNIRVLLIAMLASVLCHAIVIYLLLKFEVKYLDFTKSMNISTFRRLRNWMIVFTVLLIPEWMWISASGFDLPFVANGLLFGLTGLLFQLCLLYHFKMNMSGYLRGMLVFFLNSMWAVLSDYYLHLNLGILGSCLIYYLSMYRRIDLKSV